MMESIFFDQSEILSCQKEIDGVLFFLQFRQSQVKKTIIMAKKPRKKGYSHTKVTQDLVRFNPDPQIGRDIVFYVCLGFQAAGKYKLQDTQYWCDCFDSGDVDQGKDLVQRYIECKIQLQLLFDAHFDSVDVIFELVHDGIQMG